MTRPQLSITRRSFLRALTIASSGALLPRSLRALEEAVAPPSGSLIPERPLGRSGIRVSSLCLGGIFDIQANQHVLHRALQLGVTCWDTADCYQGGRSEIGYGQFLERQPEARREIFLISKSDARDPEGMTRLLNRSLERLHTDYLDLYMLHDLRSPSELTGEMERWVARQKNEGRIRLFGFSTHRNMEQQLLAGATLGWLDVIMNTCNFRLLQGAGMQNALEKCGSAGLGLIAIKTQGGGPIPADAERDPAGQFLGRGFSVGQAKLKAVWENPHISTICSQMHVVRHLAENAAAAMDQTTLSWNDREGLAHLAQSTCAGYCAGCERLCGAALEQPVPVADLMRSLMYARSYRDIELARECFSAIAPGIRERLLATDYTLAEQACPQGLPIARLVREAVELLA
ncbi:MAG: aldo/keto reductase [Verrucomicrobia bacterium]|nr:aldo/keto reductase [Verrucomicrobiota bacterium]